MFAVVQVANLHVSVDRKRPVVLAEADMSEADMVTPDQFFFELWDGVKSLARSVEDADTVADHYGQVRSSGNQQRRVNTASFWHPACTCCSI